MNSLTPRSTLLHEGGGVCLELDSPVDPRMEVVFPSSPCLNPLLSVDITGKVSED